MRILFDQGTPVAIRHAFTGHTVRTASEEGWSSLSNGERLRVAEEAGFEVLLTTDTNLPHQQNLLGRNLAVVILSRNRWILIEQKLADIVAGVIKAKPGTYSVVELPDR
jgi:hypothetical protein